MTIPAIPGLIDAKLAGTMRLENAYESNGQLVAQSIYGHAGMPGERLIIGYDWSDRPTALISTDGVYVSASAYDAYGNLTWRSKGDVSGLRSTYERYSYNYSTGLVEQIQYQTDKSANLDAEISYLYDQSNQIVGINRQLKNDKTFDIQCFKRDYLQRLVEAWTPKTFNCGTTPTDKTSLGGMAPYWNTWEFDAASNLTTTTDKTTNTTTRYIIGSTNTSAEPVVETTSSTSTTGSSTGLGHQVSHVVSSGLEIAFTYDKAGRQTSQKIAGEPTATALNITNPTNTTNPENTTNPTNPTNSTNSTNTVGVAGLRSQTYRWNVEGDLAQVTQNGVTTRYAYDGAGSRIAEMNTKGESKLFIGDHEFSVDAAGNVSGIRSYSLGGQKVALRQTSQAIATSKDRFAGVTVLWPDGTGSDIWQIPVTTNKPVYTLHTLYGGKRNQNVFKQRTGSKGFVGGIEDDQLGLTRIGVRDYNPVLARFITTDPITDTNDPLQWGIYSYANWDPINKIDPSGAWPSWNDITNGISKAWNGVKETAVNLSKNPIVATVVDQAVGWGIDALAGAATGAAAGLICGVTLGAGCVAIVAIATGAVIGGGAAALTKWARYEGTKAGWIDKDSLLAEDSLDDIWTDVGIGAAFGAISGYGEAKIIKLKKQIADKDKQLVDKDKQLVDKDKQLVDKDKENAELRASKAKTDKENAELRKRNEYLENMNFSQFLKMRITKKMRMFMD